MPRINHPERKRLPFAPRINPKLFDEAQAIVDTGSASWTELVEQGIALALARRRRGTRGHPHPIESRGSETVGPMHTPLSQTNAKIP